MDIISNTLITWGLEGLFTYCAKGVGGAFSHISETCGIDKPSKYSSVSSFWYDGVDHEGLQVGVKIRLSGVVSLYIPLCPRHPRSIPGKRVQTWIDMRKSNTIPSQDFATQDFVLWNDGVIAPPKSGTQKAIIGLSDKYGYVGHGCLPLIIDLKNQKLKEIYNKLVNEKPIGYEAVVTGRLVPFTIDLARDFGVVLPSRENSSVLDYPNFALEVFEIKLFKVHHILTGTVWLGYETNNIYPIYCHLLNKEENQQALVALSAEYGASKSSIIAVHDPSPFQLIHKSVPILNEKLIESFRKL
jgi:hypothetical protein